MKVGDLLLVTGPAFFEKTAIKRGKREFTPLIMVLRQIEISILSILSIKSRFLTKKSIKLW